MVLIITQLIFYTIQLFYNQIVQNSIKNDKDYRQKQLSYLIVVQFLSLIQVGFVFLLFWTKILN